MTATVAALAALAALVVALAPKRPVSVLDVRPMAESHRTPD